MHFDRLTAPEQRVLGCLIEKRWTTPDQYPLSVNALRLACNQSTNRDPVTTYDEATVRAASERLSRYGLVRLASGHSSRATKYRHLAEEGLGLGREELAVLAVLLLRGPQTPGELKSRSERMAALELARRCRSGARPRSPSAATRAACPGGPARRRTASSSSRGGGEQPAAAPDAPAAVPRRRRHAGTRLLPARRERHLAPPASPEQLLEAVLLLAGPPAARVAALGE